MKGLLKFVLIIVAILIAVAMLRDMLIKASIEAVAKHVAGAEVKIGGFSSSIIRQSVRVTGFKMYNPAGFPAGAVMIDMPEAAVSCDVPALLKGELHVPYLRLDLKEVKVIKNKDGKTNVNSLTFAQQPVGKKEKKAPGKSEPKKDMRMKFDLVSLNIGRVVIEDHSRGGANPKVTVMDINIRNKEYRNITNPAQLGSVVMLSALAPAGLDSAFALGGKGLGEAVGVVGGAAKTAGTAAKELGGTLTGVADSIGGLFKK